MAPVATIVLIAQGKLQNADLERARAIAEERNSALNPLLVRLGLVSERDLAATLLETHGLPPLNDNDLPAVPLDLPGVSTKFLKQANVLPLGEQGGRLIIGVADPEDEFALQALGLATEKKLSLKVGTVSQLERAIEVLYSDGKSSLDNMVEGLATDGGVEAAESAARLRDLASEAPIVRIVNLLISRAVESRASDIHIEPFQNQLKVRYRIDGVLQYVESPPSHATAAILSRIKIMAKLNIAERRLPQDGRIQMQSHGKSIDIRVSSIPTLHGERLVLRLLDKEQVTLDFSALGFTPGMQAELTRLLAFPHGIILVTGPTGSGKTTTLYTALQQLNQPGQNIITVEDPIEYQIPGISQIHVKPQIGLTFASALRSIVRQDPEVIMVGEMRDLETAAIAVQSALTGHLVLSTLHTNDAGSSVTRLLDMGIEDYLLTSTLNGILAQRLVRILCPSCREPYRPMPELIAELRLDRLSDNTDVTLHRAVGCGECARTGYRGRHVIAELLVMSDPVRRAIVAKADGTEIQRIALEHGMETMKTDGLRKALQGTTTIEEVTRVTQE